MNYYHTPLEVGIFAVGKGIRFPFVAFVCPKFLSSFLIINFVSVYQLALHEITFMSVTNLVLCCTCMACGPSVPFQEILTNLQQSC